MKKILAFILAVLCLFMCAGVFSRMRNHGEGKHEESSRQECLHEWDSGKTTREATCKDKGEMTYTCVECGETVKEAIPETSTHSAGEDGYCEICGEFLGLPSYRELEENEHENTEQWWK